MNVETNAAELTEMLEELTGTDEASYLASGDKAIVNVYVSDEAREKADQLARAHGAKVTPSHHIDETEEWMMGYDFEA